MRILLVVRRLLAAASLALMVAPVHAQWVVIDPSNLMENIMTYISTYQQELTQYEQLLNQEQQLQYEYAQLKSLANGDVSGLMGTVRTALINQQNYAGAVRALYGDLGNAKSVVSDLYRRMAASGLSQDEWTKREAERNKTLQEGNGYISDYQANILSQIGKRYEEVRNLQSQITGTEGTHEAMQLMNSQMNVLLATMNQLLEHNATLAQRSTNREAEAAGREKARLDNYEAWRQAQQAQAKNSDDAIKRLGGGR